MLRRGGRSDARKQPESRRHAECSGPDWRWSDMPALLGIIGVFAFGSGVRRSCPCRRPLREGEPESMAAADRPERVDGRRGPRPSEDVARHAERRSDGAHRIGKRAQPQETSSSGPGGEQPANNGFRNRRVEMLGTVTVTMPDRRTISVPSVSHPIRTAKIEICSKMSHERAFAMAFGGGGQSRVESGIPGCAGLAGDPGAVILRVGSWANRSCRCAQPLVPMF